MTGFRHRLTWVITAVFLAAWAPLFAAHEYNRQHNTRGIVPVVVAAFGETRP